jgi:hypothetical protein
MTLEFILGLAILVVGVMICAAGIADRQARHHAWRQIALERRWNSERRRPSRRAEGRDIGID